MIGVLLLSTISYCAWRNMTYSDGARAGYLVKISKKGVVFKTYEGQLDLSGIGISGDVGGGARNIWAFSVSDDEVYKELQKYEGKKVSLHYKEKMNSFPWQGDTNYFVDDVEVLTRE